MPYWIILFDKPHNHRVGDYNRDIKRVSPIFSDILKVEKYLYRIMSQTSKSEMFLRIDWNERFHPVIYADCNNGEWLIRFKTRDGYHWTSAITLEEFRQRLVRMARNARS